MDDLVVLVLVTTAAAAACTAVAVSLVIWRLRRRNRVSPRVKSQAPLWWLWSPSRPARLHRRLRSAVSAARYGVDQSGPDSPIADLVAELERQAVVIDRQLVTAAQSPSSIRYRLLNPLTGQVRDFERIVERVLSEATAAAGESPQAALGRVTERLDALESARDEIARLEAALGLRSDGAERLRPHPGRTAADRRAGH
jgi:hypothetical protein